MGATMALASSGLPKAARGCICFKLNPLRIDPVRVVAFCLALLFGCANFSLPAFAQQTQGGSGGNSDNIFNSGGGGSLGSPNGDPGVSGGGGGGGGPANSGGTNGGVGGGGSGGSGGGGGAGVGAGGNGGDGGANGFVTNDTLFGTNGFGNAGVAGAAGSSAAIGGGGGGGGAGGYGAVVLTNSAGDTVNVNLTGGVGGAGGSGGAGSPNGQGGAGGGGGGALFYFTSSAHGSLFISTGVTLQGGAGGAAGASFGTGGGGGIGIDLSDGILLNNSGTIQGGAPGADTGAGSGFGGNGVAGSDLTVVNSAGGTISGGGSGALRGDAILFEGGTNVLDLEGTSGAQLFGNIELIGPNVVLSFTQSQAQTVSNLIVDVFGSDHASIVQNGAGALTLSNANIYNGGTTIDQGTLSLAHATAGTIDAAGTGIIALNGGQLELAASGTLANDLIIALPNIDISATTGTTATLTGNLIVNNGPLRFGSAADKGTIVLNEAGGVIAVPALLLEVAGGTLQAATGPSVGFFTQQSITTTQIDSGATLDFNGQTGASATIANLFGSGTLTNSTGATTFIASGNFDGVIAGGGAIELPGPGTLTLSGTNTFTGNTFIDTGATLNLSGTGSISQSAGVDDAGTFDISALTNGGTSIKTLVNGGIVNLGANTLTLSNAGSAFQGTINGSGGLTLGAGFEQLASTNTYTGQTTINGGLLAVTGSIATSSLTNVNSGGTLSGNGTVGNTHINAGGSFQPGWIAANSQMNVSGSLAFASGATYAIGLTPTVTTSANVTGTASLAGTVQATFAAGSYVPHQYTILQSSGLGGTTFGGVATTDLPAGFAANLTYNAGDVFLNLVAQLGIGGSLNGNQQNVANAINGFFNGGGTLPPNFVTLFGLSGSALPQALSQLSGEAATGAEKGAFAMMTEFLDLMMDPWVDGRSGAGGAALGFAPDRATDFPPDIALAYAHAIKAPPQQTFDQRWTAWGSGFGGYNRTSGDAVAGTNTVTAQDYGFAAGMDYHFTRDTLMGFALAGGGTRWGLAQNLGGGRSDAFQAGLYGRTNSGPAYLAASLAFANHWMTTDRTAALGDQLTASFDGQSYGGRLEAGYRYAATPTLGVTPYAAGQVQSFHTPSFSETDVTGGGFGLNFNAMSATDTRSELGARFDDLSALGTVPLILRARLAWAHDWVSNPALGAVFETLPGASFTVNGAAPPKDSALTTAAAELQLTRNWSFAAKFDGEFAKSAETYAGTGTLRYQW